MKIREGVTVRNMIAILKKNENIISAEIRNSSIISMNIAKSDSHISVGDIYIGKVKNIVKNINAAFVEITDGQMCYLSLSENVIPAYISHAANTNKAIVCGDEILVQVKKEASKTKPPTLTLKLDVSSRYMVLTAGKTVSGVSSKIKDKDKRDIINEVMSRYSNDKYGFIARTNAQFIEKDELESELQQLIKEYDDLCSRASHLNCFSCVKKASPDYLTQIRDIPLQSLDRIVTNDGKIFNEIKEYVGIFTPELNDVVELWNEADQGDMDSIIGISKKMEEALRTKVWLKSGGYLVIQPTEAMVVIDVNTGKAVSKKTDMEKTFFKVNMEAANQIAYQLRLRNLSGIIIIDFIDMKEEENKERLINELKAAFLSDPIKSTVVDMTALGLVEVTRKKQKRPLYEQVAGVEIEEDLNHNEED